MNKKFLLALIGILLLTAVPTLAQVDDTALMAFSRAGSFADVNLVFIHLNDATVDEVFSPPHSVSWKVRAKSNDLFFVQGEVKQDARLSTDFILVQDDQEFEGTAHDIENFRSGFLTQGLTVSGVLQFDSKVDLARPFKLISDDGSVTFDLSQDALGMLE